MSCTLYAAMQLRVRLNLIVIGLSAAFVTILLIAELRSARLSIAEEIGAANRVAEQLLGNLALDESPDSNAGLLPFLEELGRVRANDIALYSPSGDLLYRSPPSTWKAGRYAPDWFSGLMAPEPLSQVFELPYGRRLVVEAESSRAVLDAWDAFIQLLAIGIVMLVAFNLAAFWLVSRSLEPFPAIMQGLARLQRGELGYRLPKLSGAEARAVGDAFNSMAEAVEDKVRAENQARDAEARLEERRELGRLIERKLEEERRLIAHELHDEFSQSVTAIRSLALAITSRTQDSESLTSSTAQLIADEAGRLYDAMHGLIPRLEPLSFDTIGLSVMLENLVRGWRRRCPDVELELSCEPDLELEQMAALTVFRVVQEGLINALRHGAPSRVGISVLSGAQSVKVIVTDDGRGLPSDWDRSGHFGLRGLTDRVSSVGGTFTIRNHDPRGVELEAVIPTSTGPGA